jgi:PAS domain S-box-containing protein
MFSQSASHYRSLIERSPIASIISNPRVSDNPIVACNNAFKELTGYNDDEILGRNCRFLAGPATEPWLSHKIQDGVRQHTPTLVEIINYKKNGTPFRNAVLVSPVFDDDGELQLFLGSQVELSDDAAMPYANRAMAAAVRVKSLTTRQRQVLAEMALGHLNKQIAYNLHVSEQTVKMHRAAMMVKLGATNTADAIRVAVEAGL